MIFSLFSTRPSDLGADADGRLVPCPDTPNCVSSQAEAGSPRRVAPLAYTGDPAAAWGRLTAAVAEELRGRTVERTDRYLHAECTTPLLRFIDDLECLLDPGDGTGRGVIHVRSASRLGRSDFGTNRRRVERLRAAFEAADADAPARV